MKPHEEKKKEQPKKPVQFTFVPKKAIEAEVKRLKGKKI